MNILSLCRTSIRLHTHEKWYVWKFRKKNPKQRELCSACTQLFRTFSLIVSEEISHFSSDFTFKQFFFLIFFLFLLSSADFSLQLFSLFFFFYLNFDFFFGRSSPCRKLTLISIFFLSWLRMPRWCNFSNNSTLHLEHHPLAFWKEADKGTRLTYTGCTTFKSIDTSSAFSHARDPIWDSFFFNCTSSPSRVMLHLSSRGKTRTQRMFSSCFLSINSSPSSSGSSSSGSVRMSRRRREGKVTNFFLFFFFFSSPSASFALRGSLTHSFIIISHKLLFNNGIY